MNRREFIAASGVLTAAAAAGADEKTTDGGFAEVSWADRAKKPVPVVPAGAHSVERFARKCIGCGRCAAVCPSKILRQDSLTGRVELDFRYGWCRIDCVRCAEVCSTGAIERLSGLAKRDVHVGIAVFRRDLCVRKTEGDACYACEKHCPVKAVTLVDGFPVVDGSRCIGCGACEHYCPARPVTAISVKGLEVHREVRAMSEADLLAEMKTLIDSGKSAVVAKDGVIVLMLEGRGLAPIEDAVRKDPDVFRGAVVADKVVGLAASKIYEQGRAKTVYGRVMSEGAKKRLDEAGIVTHHTELVKALACEEGR